MLKEAFTFIKIWKEGDADIMKWSYWYVLHIVLLYFIAMKMWGDCPHTHWHASLWSRGPFSLVQRALTHGLWPSLEAKPFFPVLHLLLEDHTLFILLASFLSSALSLRSFVLLEAGAEHGFNAFTAEGTSTAPVFTFDLRHFQALLTMCFHLCISTMCQGWGSWSRILSCFAGAILFYIIHF